MNRITLRELAAYLGMSKSTVQRALSGVAEVKAEKRELVLAAAEKFGYTPDVFFSTLSGHRRKSGSARLTVAYVHQSPLAGRFAAKGMNLMPQLQREGKGLGFEVQHLQPDTFPSPEAMLRQIWARGAAGILVGAVNEDSAAALRAFGKLPVVSLIREEALPFHTVRFAVAQALRLCWQKLWELGYRRIGCAVMRHDPVLLDDLDRFGAALALSARDQKPSERIPPLRAPVNDSEAFQVWLTKYKAEAVIGFNPGLFWECKTPEGKPIPFVCLHTGPHEGLRHIPGAYEPEELYALQALRQLDGLIRHGECGVPEHAYELIIHTLWCPGRPPLS